MARTLTPAPASAAEMEDFRALAQELEVDGELKDETRPERSHTRTLNPINRLSRREDSVTGGEGNQHGVLHTLPAATRSLPVTAIRNGVTVVHQLPASMKPKPDETQRIQLVQPTEPEHSRMRMVRTRGGSELAAVLAGRPIEPSDTVLIDRLLEYCPDLDVARNLCLNVVCSEKGVRPFASLELLTYHVSLEHWVSGQILCLVCGRQSEAAAPHKAHMRSAHASLDSMHSAALASARPNVAKMPRRSAPVEIGSSSVNGEIPLTQPQVLAAAALRRRLNGPKQDGPHQCTTCGDHFQTPQALGMHRTKCYLGKFDYHKERIEAGLVPQPAPNILRKLTPQRKRRLDDALAACSPSEG